MVIIAVQRLPSESHFETGFLRTLTEVFRDKSLDINREVSFADKHHMVTFEGNVLKQKFEASPSGKKYDRGISGQVF